MRTKKQRRARFSPAQAFGVSGRGVHELLAPQPLIHWNCNGSLHIENSREVLRYDAGCVVLDMGSCRVHIEGDGLVMDVYQKDAILLHGRIFSVQLQGV